MVPTFFILQRKGVYLLFYSLQEVNMIPALAAIPEEGGRGSAYSQIMEGTSKLHLGDFEKAFEYFQNAAALDDSIGLVFAISLIGRGPVCVAKGYREACIAQLAPRLSWIRREAEEKVNALAQYALGFCQANGVCVPQNRESAREWFSRSAENGCALAHVNLGDLYVENGDLKNAEANFREAGKKLVPLGYVHLAKLHEGRDEAKVFHLYERAANVGCVAAYIGLARCYEKGIGTPINQKRAEDLLREARLHGFGTEPHMPEELEDAPMDVDPTSAPAVYV